MTNSSVSLFIAFIIFGPFLCLLMATAQILKKENRISFYYSLAHITMGLWLFQSLVYSTNLFSHSYYITTILLPVSFLAPLFQRYRYTWVVFSSSQTITNYSRILYSMSFFSLIFISVIFLTSDGNDSKKYIEFQPILAGDFIELPFQYKLLHLLYPASKFISIISLTSILLILIKYRKEKKDDAPVKFIRVSLLVITMILTATIFVLAGNFISFTLSLYGLSFATLTICTMVIISYRFPSLKKYVIFEVNRTRYHNSKITRLDVDSIISRISEIMEIEKAYADEDFSLKHLARELDITTHQLSQIINEKIGKNFNTFLNEYRIKESKRLLLEEPGRSINSIANSVGYNSNTAFTLAFSRHEGCSPSRYRKKNI